MAGAAWQEKVRLASFAVSELSAPTQRTVLAALDATLAAPTPEADDWFLSVYIGCRRPELLAIIDAWRERQEISLSDANIVWAVIVNALMLLPWRDWVPLTPTGERLEAARLELEGPIHERTKRIANDGDD